MKTFTITVTDEIGNALEIIAKKDGITSDELVQNQMDYYIKCVVKDYAGKLNETQKAELDTRIKQVTSDYISEISLVIK